MTDNRIRRQVPAPLPRVRTFVLKVASRCNLDCTYCYVYNKGDTSWRARPKLMPPEVQRAAITRIRDYAEAVDLSEVRLTIHGGEPTLLGSDRFATLCTEGRTALTPRPVKFAIQTNGILLDDAWGRVLAEHNVHVGVSVDGPRDVHDRHRIDHAGLGSFDRVKAGVAKLRAAGVRTGALCVLPLGEDPLRVHEACPVTPPAPPE